MKIMDFFQAASVNFSMRIDPGIPSLLPLVVVRYLDQAGS
jgi:hypothetical protein